MLRWPFTTLRLGASGIFASRHHFLFTITISQSLFSIPFSLSMFLWRFFIPSIFDLVIFCFFFLIASSHHRLRTVFSFFYLFLFFQFLFSVKLCSFTLILPLSNSHFLLKFSLSFSLIIFSLPIPVYLQ